MMNDPVKLARRLQSLGWRCIPPEGMGEPIPNGILDTRAFNVIYCWWYSVRCMDDDRKQAETWPPSRAQVLAGILDGSIAAMPECGPRTMARIEAACDPLRDPDAVQDLMRSPKERERDARDIEIHRLRLSGATYKAAGAAFGLTAVRAREICERQYRRGRHRPDWYRETFNQEPPERS